MSRGHLLEIPPEKHLLAIPQVMIPLPSWHLRAAASTPIFPTPPPPPSTPPLHLNPCQLVLLSLLLQPPQVIFRCQGVCDPNIALCSIFKYELLDAMHLKDILAKAKLLTAGVFFEKRLLYEN